jgi:hypothetical protein
MKFVLTLKVEQNPIFVDREALQYITRPFNPVYEQLARTA